MANTCKTCFHFRPCESGLRRVTVGKCHVGPGPKSDFHFPRVEETDFCAAWKAAPKAKEKEPTKTEEAKS